MTGVRELLQVTLDVWHPDCWGIISTNEVGSRLVGHGVAVTGSSAYERCTIHGESRAHIDQAIEVANDVQFIETIERLADSTCTPVSRSSIGHETQDVFIEYDAADGMGSAFFERGFVLDGTYRIDGGLETWELLVYAPRRQFQRTLAEIERDRNAAITIRRLSPVETTHQTQSSPATELTACQREAFELARSQGYYGWPRDVSVKALAADLDVSKATFLEHLRKAEAKLLGSE